jgi:hypothetical protein
MSVAIPSLRHDLLSRLASELIQCELAIDQAGEDQDQLDAAVTSQARVERTIVLDLLARGLRGTVAGNELLVVVVEDDGLAEPMRVQLVHYPLDQIEGLSTLKG